MANKSISQLDSAAVVDNGDLFEIAQPDLSSASGYKSYKQSLAAMADHMATQVLYPGLNTTSKSLVGAINEIYASGGGKILTGTLAAGQTSVTLSDATITNNSTFDIYTDTLGVSPYEAVVTTGSITLTFEAQLTNIAVKVKVS